MSFETSLSSFLGKHPKIIINNDLDGIFSGYFLKSLYGAEIVGMTNSKEREWPANGYVKNGNEIYVDIYAFGKKCIDQHIPPMALSNVLNPNIERGIFAFDDYKRKFPFSCSMYILAKAAEEGETLDHLFKWNTHFNDKDNVYWLDYFLRGDGILKNCIDYEKNTDDWWIWLLDLSRKDTTIERLKETMDSLKKNVGERFTKWKNDVESSLHDKYGFSKEEFEVGSTGSTIFCKKIGLELPSFGKPTIHHKRELTKISSREEYIQFTKTNKLYSFAFYCSANGNSKNFSYTLD